MNNKYYLKSYKWIDYENLKFIFSDIKKIFNYWNSIVPIFKKKETYNRVWSHLILVEQILVKNCYVNWKYKKELQVEYQNILTRTKRIKWLDYSLLIDNKTDQSREVVDYIIKNDIHTHIYILSDDNMFWFFHDMGHSYLADICDNFYENVYWYPEQLVNLFAAIKLKQYWFYNYDYIIEQAVTKCYWYPKEDHEYFLSILDTLNFKNDI